MDRLGFSEHFLRVISSLYDSPTFFVQDQYGTSLTKSQLTGIRQGCPLSPYLFLLVMTCVDHDVQRLCSKNVTNSRIPGVEFDAVFYADDTILFSTKPRALNELLKHMENCSERYGLKINRRKCHTLHMHREASIHFQDNTVLHKAHDATYLGNNLNCKVNLAREWLKESKTPNAHGKNWTCIGKIRAQERNGNSLFMMLLFAVNFFTIWRPCVLHSHCEKSSILSIYGAWGKSFKYPGHTSIGGIRMHVFMSWLLKLLTQMILIKVFDLFLQYWMRSELT